MRQGPAALESHAHGAEALLLDQPQRLRDGDGLGLGVPALRQVQQPLLAFAADDRELPPAVEAFRPDGDSPRLLDRDGHASGGTAQPVPLGYRTSSSPSTRASRAAARSSFAPTFPRTPGSGWKRRTLSMPSARSAFRSARPT